jgi:hypothetical protein
MAFVSLDSPSCEVPCLILLSVVNRDVTQQAKGLYHLKHVGALKSGLTYLSRYNSGWFCHSNHRVASGCRELGPPDERWLPHPSSPPRLQLVVNVYSSFESK